MHGESFRRRYAAGRVHRVESNHVGAENQPGTGPHHHVRRTPGLLRRRLAALEYILSERLTEQADTKGALYESLLAGHPLVREIRRTGLLLGVEFGDSELTARIVLRAIDRGLMTEWFLFHDTAMRIAPPLTITDAEIRESCEILLEVLNGAAE